MDMDKELIVKCSRRNLYYIGGLGCLFLFLIGIFCWNFFEEAPGAFGISSPIIGVFIMMALYLIFCAYILKNDCIRVDLNGIYIDAHSCDFIPKRYQASYAWTELSTYALDVVWKNSHPYFKLELYDKNECLIQKFELQSLLETDLILMESYIPDDILYKPAYDFNKYGKTTFYSRKDNLRDLMCIGIFSLLFGIAFFILCIKAGEMEIWTTSLGVIFSLSGLCFVYGAFVTKRDYLTIDDNGITIDLYTRGLFIHKYKVLPFGSFDYFSVSETPEECVLRFFDKDKNEIFSCDCMNLTYARYIDWVLTGLLTE